MANDSAGVRIIDISEPLQPFEVGHYQTDHCAEAVDILGDLLFIAQRHMHYYHFEDVTDLLVLDVSDINELRLVGFYDGHGFPMGVAVDEEYIYLSNVFHIHILEYTPGEGVGDFVQGTLPDAWRIMSVYPNPFNPVLNAVISLPQPTNLRVTLVDVLGREVGVLTDRFQPAGYQHVTFDGTGLSSGIYFLRVNAPGAMDEMRKVILLR